MSTARYPTDLPIGEIQSLISTIRAGSIVADKADFAKSLWLVQGYVQGVVLGDTPDAKAYNPFPVSEKALSNEDAATFLEQMIQEQAHPEILQAIPIPWTLLLKWAASLLLTLIV